MIHVIGDSHVYAFTGVPWKSRDYEYYTEANGWQIGKYDPFHTYWLGPRTCYKFMEKCSSTVDDTLKKYWKSGDHVIFCCGEIDCRCHVPTHKAEFFEDPIQATQVIVDRYLALLERWKAYDPIPLLCPPLAWCSEFNSLLLGSRQDAWPIVGSIIDGTHFDARLNFLKIIGRQ